MARFDEEVLLNNLETVLKANLNTKITAINSEKSDSITLTAIDNNAYQLDTDDKISNYNPYIIYMISEQTTEARGSATAENIVINIALIVTDNGNDLNIVKKMLRYRRCLKEVIEDNYRKISYCDSVIIESLPILSFQKSSNSHVSKICGINIITTIC